MLSSEDEDQQTYKFDII